MPIAKLSTGINLYYESYGRGEAIVFIPGTEHIRDGPRYVSADSAFSSQEIVFSKLRVAISTANWRA